MPEKTLFFTRHGQGHHNVDDKTHIRDALLTDEGIEQARLHNESIRDNVSKQAELIVCSPLRRTVQTMLYGYADAVARLGKDRIIIMPEVQEASDDPCDTGLDKADLLKDPLYQGLDLSRLDDDWNAKKGKFAATSEAIQARALWVRKFLRDRPESCIVLVSHNDFLEGVYPQENTPGGWSRMNLGTRQYIFCAADGEEDEEAKLKEVCSVTKEGQLSNERPI